MEVVVDMVAILRVSRARDPDCDKCVVRVSKLEIPLVPIYPDRGSQTLHLLLSLKYHPG